MEAAFALDGGLTEAHPLVLGAVATVLAAFALGAWLAIGSIFIPRSIDDDLALAGSILIGSGVTAFVFALLTRAGMIDGAIWMVGAASAAALAARYERVRKMISSLVGVYAQTVRSSRVLSVVAFPLAGLLWIDAIAPPRDGDVMRYHLAHIRQIISDGRWEAIADYHYAFPFGWTLNYLPFERLHLPQAAALVNVALWLLVLGGVLRLAQVSPLPRIATLAAIGFFVHPFVVRTFASAMADAYAVFAVYAIALMLLRLDDRNQSAAILAGFVCWIGAQSRYQLIAFSLAGSILFVVHALRRGWLHELRQFGIGATGAIALSAPFYLSNLRDLGNPVWPLLVPQVNGISSYADRVAAAYTARMTGSHDPAQVLQQAWDLISTPALIPLAAILLVVVLTSLLTKDVRYRRVAVLGTLFLALWLAMEPRFFPRHVIMLLPLGAMLFVQALGGLSSRAGLVRGLDRLLVVAIPLLVTAAGIVSWDYVRYAVTGDDARFHRFTWYYPVYGWVNRHTPRESRILVITYSGHSYYLDRQYRRADPWLSGVVDWSRVSSAYDLQSVLSHGNYTYIIYDDRDWRDFPSGGAMSSAIKSAIAEGLVVPVHKSRERLYSSRVMRDYSESDVYVLAVRSSTAGARSAGGKNASLNRSKNSGDI